MNPHSTIFRMYLLLTILFCSALLSSGRSNIDYRRPIEIRITCCTEVSKAKINDVIISFRIQHGNKNCAHAVIFRTEKNGSFCSDPKAKWVQRKIQNMKKSATRKQ